MKRKSGVWIAAMFVAVLIAAFGVHAQPVTGVLPVWNQSNPLNFTHAYVYTQRSPVNPIEYDNIFAYMNYTSMILGGKFYGNEKNGTVKFYLGNGTSYQYIVARLGNNTAPIYSSSGNIVGYAKEYYVLPNKSNPYWEVALTISPPPSFSSNFTLLVQRNAVGCTNTACMLLHDLCKMKISENSSNWYWGHWRWNRNGRGMGWMRDLMRFHYARHIYYYPEVSYTYPTLPPQSEWIHLNLTPIGTNELNVTVPVSLPYTTLIITDGSHAYQFPAEKGTYSVRVANTTSIYVVYGGNMMTSGVSAFATLASITGINTTEVHDVSLNLTYYTFSLGNVSLTLISNAPVSGTVKNNSVDLTASTITTVNMWSTGKVVVLRGARLIYNPRTSHYQFVIEYRPVHIIEVPVHGFMVIAAPQIEMLKVKKGTVRMCVQGNGTVIVSNPTTGTNGTFAVAHNATAMKRYMQYIDVRNYTAINTTPGNLTIYYHNPCTVSTSVNAVGIVVTVHTPYTFHGRINVTEAGRVVFSENVTVAAPGENFTISFANMSNTSTSAFSMSTGPSITVYDLDSQQVIGTESVNVTGLITPVWAAVIIVGIVAVAALTVYLMKKSRTAAIREVEKRGKYFRKI